MHLPARLRPQPRLWLALFLLAGIGMLAGAGWLARDAALRLTADEVNQNLALFTTYLQSEVEKVALLAALHCGNPDVLALLGQSGTEGLLNRVNLALERANRTAATARSYVVDDNAHILAGSDWRQPDSIIGTTRFDRRYWRELTRAAGAAFVAFDQRDQGLGYYAVCPVNRGSERLGTVVVRGQVAALTQAWESVAEAGMHLLVADQYGVIFKSSEPRWALHTLSPLAPEERAKLARTGQYLDAPLPPLGPQPPIVTREHASLVTLPGEDGAGKTYLAQAQDLAGTGWTVIVASDLAAVRRWVLAALVSTAGVLALIGLLVIYLHQRRRYLVQVVEASLHDPLTGLYTRAYMTDAVARLEGLQDRGEGVAVALAMFDLDHFKRVNDTYGHRCGDAVLRQTGRIILEEVRDSDIPVRYGGEELAVFLSVHTLDEAVQFAERVLRRMRELRQYEKWTLNVTVSAGVALRHPGEPLPHLIERADRLLYEAKHAGRDRVVAGDDGS